MPKRRFAACLLILSALLSACGSSSTDAEVEGEEDELGHPPAAMVGRWVFQSATVDGTPTALTDALEWTGATVQARLNVEANGTYWYEELNASGAQTWAEGGWVFVDPEGSLIEVNVQWDSDGSATDQFEMTYTLSGNVLTLQRQELGSTLVFTLSM